MTSTHQQQSPLFHILRGIVLFEPPGRDNIIIRPRTGIRPIDSPIPSPLRVSPFIHLASPAVDNHGMKGGHREHLHPENIIHTITVRRKHIGDIDQRRDYLYIFQFRRIPAMIHSRRINYPSSCLPDWAASLSNRLYPYTNTTHTTAHSHFRL